MTLVVAWERRVGPLTELIIASDSRLNGGEQWDGGAKVFTIPDFPYIIAFAGNTALAYPFVLQALAQAQAYGAHSRRASSPNEFARHLAKTFEALRSQGGRESTHSLDSFEVLVGGWAWREQKFDLLRVAANRGAGALVAERIRPALLRLRGRDDTSKRLFAMLGDREGKTHMLAHLRKRAESGLSGDFAHEPLDGLLEVCRNAGVTSIGGALQVAKVYRTMHSEAFVVQLDGRVFLAGREVYAGERLDLRRLGRTAEGHWAVTGP
jgi:hypothetical protein